MPKKNAVIAGVLLALLVLNFAVKPYMRRRDALRVVNNVLTDWKNGDLTLAMSYWEREADSPPIYNLVGFKIEDSRIKKIDGRHAAEVTAFLEFAANTQFPTDRRWMFELIKTRYGWRVKNFRLLDE